MYIDHIEAAPLMTNCYLLGDEESKLCAVVDPGGSTAKVMDMIDRSGMTPTMILLTHGHYDHTGAVEDLLVKWPALPVYIHTGDLCPAGETRERFRMTDKGPNQRTYNDGDALELGGISIQVLHTPGHSPGSVTLLAEDVMFSGDTLFAGSCGRWDLPGGDEEALQASLARLGRLEGEYRVLPGHGSATLLSREREYNSFVRRAMA